MPEEGVGQVVITRMNVVETRRRTWPNQPQKSAGFAKSFVGSRVNKAHPYSRQRHRLHFSPRDSLPARGQRASGVPGCISMAYRKANTHALVTIDRIEVVKVDQQLLAFRTDTIRCRTEKYSSPSHKKTSLAALSTGDHGERGLGVKAWVLTRYDADGISEPHMLDLLHPVGMSMSAGLVRGPGPHLDRTRTTVNGKQGPCQILGNCLLNLAW
jgi:hypothetical protein